MFLTRYPVCGVLSVVVLGVGSDRYLAARRSAVYLGGFHLDIRNGLYGYEETLSVRTVIIFWDGSAAAIVCWSVTALALFGKPFPELVNK